MNYCFTKPIHKKLYYYRKLVRSNTHRFNCPHCHQKYVLPAKFETHCTRQHDFNLKTHCVWCKEMFSKLKSSVDKVGKRKFAINHLIQCFKKFIISKSYKKDSPSSLEKDPECFDSMATNISFFKLPSLVQAKIIRQHVSTFQKAFQLSNMPEFSGLLESKHCWLNPSREFFKFVRLIKSLKPGIHLCKRGIWSHGISVSISENVISFVLVGVHKMILDIMGGEDSHETAFDFNGSFSKMSEFLTTFLNTYTFFDRETIGIYKLRYGYFYVNYSTKTVHWMDGEVHALNNGNECVISDIFGEEHVRLVLRDDNSVRLFCLATFRWGDYNCPCQKTCVTLEPLKSFLKRDKNTNFKLEFRIAPDEDCVSIHTECFKVETCCGFLNPELFQKFQKLVDKSV